MKLSGPGVYFHERSLVSSLISPLVIDLMKFSISSWQSVGDLCLKICPFHLSCPCVDIKLFTVFPYHSFNFYKIGSYVTSLILDVGNLCLLSSLVSVAKGMPNLIFSKTQQLLSLIFLVLFLFSISLISILIFIISFFVCFGFILALLFLVFLRWKLRLWFEIFLI